jgi:hypothetical protein
MTLFTLFRAPALARLSEALRLLPAERIRAGAPVHPSLRHLASDPELRR